MLFSLALAAHLACAFGAAALFWIPLCAVKGGPLHIRAGRGYTRLIYLTALTGAPLAALLYARAAEPGARHTAAFLIYLLVILVMPVFHGVRVLRAAGAGTPVTSPAHTAAALAAIAAGLTLGALAIAWQEWPYLLLSPVGPVMGVRALVYARRGNSSRMNIPGSTNREYSSGKEFPGAREEHLVSMMVSGIAVHTAMLVFGSTRTLGIKLTGVSLYVPWLLPAIIGLPALLWIVKRERDAAAARR